jgi:hypothetical protein
MGWIGSLVTIRGVTLMTNVPKAETTTPTAQTSQVPVQKAQPQPQKAKAKPVEKPVEPEMIVIPLEEMEQQQPTQREPKQSK